MLCAMRWIVVALALATTLGAAACGSQTEKSAHRSPHVFAWQHVRDVFESSGVALPQRSSDLPSGQVTMFPPFDPQAVLERPPDASSQFIIVDVTRRIAKPPAPQFLFPPIKGEGLYFATAAVNNVYVLYRLRPALSHRAQAAIAILRREARS